MVWRVGHGEAGGALMLKVGASTGISISWKYRWRFRAGERAFVDMGSGEGGYPNCINVRG
jgi:hypothetical protein